MYEGDCGLFKQHTKWSRYVILGFIFHPITSPMVAIVLCVDLIVASLAHRWGHSVSQVQSITFGRFFNHSLQKALTTDYDSVLVIKHFLGSWKTDLNHDMRFFQLSSFWSDMWEEIVIRCLYLKQVATVNSCHGDGTIRFQCVVDFEGRCQNIALLTGQELKCSGMQRWGVSQTMTCFWVFLR